MVKRARVEREPGGSLSPSSPPRTTTCLCRPTTPTRPVQIPQHGNRETAHGWKRQTTSRRKHARHPRSPDSLSPSLAALLAVTDIPRQTRRRADCHVRDVPVRLVSESEKDLSPTPMDVLLSPPDDDDEDAEADDGTGASEGRAESVLARTTSADSVPSLGGSVATDSPSSSSVATPDSRCSDRRRRRSPVRKHVEPVRAPTDAAVEHPLAADAAALDELVAILPRERPDEGDDDEEEAGRLQFLESFKPLRSVFKSNLTASFRALRSAAKSFSSFHFPSMPPDDLMTRSMLTIDPNVPYADERRPPVSEEMPSPELRRYLNPTTASLFDAQPKPPRFYAASIQMQTYKVQRSRFPHTSAYPSVSPQSPSSAAAAAAEPPTRPGSSQPVPGMRQREVRENSDFIRIAVLEMTMRRRGKLDNQRPGRARWTLPPRRPPTTPYEIRPNGIPARWTSVSY
ncbi:hypothetical protein RJ55_01165 [Drechmeria coniospora]|nr:hypothetical protein RJ55_01165 [Drechmeria coniospora]